MSVKVHWKWNKTQLKQKSEIEETKARIEILRSLLNKRVSASTYQNAHTSKKWKIFFYSNTGESKLQVIQEWLAVAIFSFYLNR